MVVRPVRLSFAAVVVVSLAALFALLVAVLPPGARADGMAPMVLPSPISSDSRFVDPSPSPTTEPTVVRELVDKRTATSSTFLMSDGTCRLRTYDEPIRFLDENGKWQEIDTTLIPNGTPGEVESASTEAQVTIATEAPGQAPVSIAADGSAVSFNLLGAVEDSQLVLGDTALYPAVTTATDVSYEVTSDGVKETLLLSSKAAPASFTYFVADGDLTLLKDDAGQWGFYQQGVTEPLFVISPLVVTDSATGTSSACDGARMTVRPAPGGSYVTYAVPREWLDDPARVYPVKIDPTVILNGSGSVTYDTYVLDYPGEMGTGHGSDTQLKVGNISSTEGYGTGLLHFNLNTLKEHNEYVTDASLNLRCYDIPSTGRSFDVYSTKRAWTSSETWNSFYPYQDLSYSFNRPVGTAFASAGNWMTVPCRKMTQAWVSGNEPDYGFAVVQKSTSQSYSARFRSGDFSGSTFTPHLDVSYAADPPHAQTITTDKPSYNIGDTATVTVTLDGAPLADVRQVRLGINRKAEVADRYRGVMCWSDTPSPGDDWVMRPIEQAKCGYFGYYRNDSDGYGSRYVTPLLEDCKKQSDNKSQFVFKFKVNENWGNVQANKLDANIVMWPSDDAAYWDNLDEPYWISGWKQPATTEQSFDVVPVLSEAPTATTSVVADANDPNHGWDVKADANHDGLDDAAATPSNKGRGVVTLDWSTVTDAAGYKIYLWDGRAYQQVGTATSGTTWNTSGKGIYPSAATIAALSPSTPAGSVFKTGTGCGKLRDNPNEIYRKTDSPSDAYACNSWTHYSFRVVPYFDASHQAAVTDSIGVGVTLDNRTRHAYEAPQRLTTAVSDLPDNAVQAVLDVGDFTSSSDDIMRLGVSATDLALASWGPPATLDRYYDSSVTSSGNFFAPGWRFGFERRLDLSKRDVADQHLITYVDSYGASYPFCGSDVRWYAPNGLRARLEHPSGGSYRLTFKDGGYLVFDGSSGVLQTEGDACGNEVTYSVTPTQAVITAANGRRIVATVSNGKITSATTDTGGANRSVTYGQGSGSATPWTVTRTVSLAQDGPAWWGLADRKRRVAYSYDGVATGGPCLTSIEVKALDGSGQPLASGSEPTWREEFTYAHSADHLRDKLTEVKLPDYFAVTPGATLVPNARLSFDYSQAEKLSIDRWATVAGASGTKVTKTITYNQSGTLRSESRPFAAGGNADHLTSYAYAPDNALACTTSPAGSIAQTVFDCRGNAIASANTRGGGAVTAYYYDGNPFQDGINDLPATTYSARGSVGHISYWDPALRLVGQTQVEGAGYAAHVPDPSRPTAAVEATAHAPNATSGPDAELSQTDYTYAPMPVSGPSGTRQYAGWLTAQETATGSSPDAPVYARTLYEDPDLCGQAKTTKNVGAGCAPPDDATKDRPASGDEAYHADDIYLTTARTFDAFGSVLSKSAPGPNGHSVDALSTYDASGRLIASAGPVVPGQVSGQGRLWNVSLYDAMGRQKEVFTYNDGPDGLVRDAQGQPVTPNKPILTGWATTEYVTVGTGERVTVRRLNGDAGKVASPEVAATLTTESDESGRQVGSNDGTVGGHKAETQYDAAGNDVKSWPQDVHDGNGDNVTTLDNAHATTHTYNADGKPLTAHDPSTGLNPDTNTLYKTVSTYNPDGSVAKIEDPDGSWTCFAYDLSGARVVVTEPADNFNATDRKYAVTTARTTFDTQGHVSREIDAGGGESSFTYDAAGRQIVSLRLSSEPNEAKGTAVNGIYPDDTTTYTTYNSLGWKMREYSGDVDGPAHAPDGKSDDLDREWEYNQDGSVKTMTVIGRLGRASGSGAVQVTTYEYDDAGRVLCKKTSPSTSEVRSIENSYDCFGRLTTETQAKTVSGARTVLRQTSFSYDCLGRTKHRTVKVIDLDTGQLKTAIEDDNVYGYVNAGLHNAVKTTTTLTMAPVAGANASPATEVLYVDGRGRGVSQSFSVPGASGNPALSSVSDSVIRDAADRVTGMQVGLTEGETPSNGGSTGVFWTYTAKGRLSGQDGMGLSSAAAYGYNGVTGRRTTATVNLLIGSNLDEKYIYFDDGRVKKAGAANDAQDGTFSYNRHGAIKTAQLGSVTRTLHYGAGSRLEWSQNTDQDRYYYKWDANFDRRTGMNVGVKNDGDWSAPSTYKTDYFYDNMGELTAWDDDSDSGHMDMATYTYDAAGQRIRTVVTEDYNLSLANQTVTTTDYLWDGLKLVSTTVKKTTGNPNTEIGRWQEAYFYDVLGRPYAGVDRRLTDGVTQSFYLVSNDHGDVLELLDADHLRFAGYRYDAYGRPTEQTVRTTDSAAISASWAAAIASRNLLRYAGYCWDEHSSLYYLQRRYYDPLTRQFISSDPLKADGDESLYQYCGGSPLTGTDPTGEQVPYIGDTSSNAGLTPTQRAQLNQMTAQTYAHYGAGGGGSGSGGGSGGSGPSAAQLRALQYASILPGLRVVLGGLADSVAGRTPNVVGAPTSTPTPNAPPTFDPAQHPTVFPGPPTGPFWSQAPPQPLSTWQVVQLTGRGIAKTGRAINNARYDLHDAAGEVRRQSITSTGGNVYAVIGSNVLWVSMEIPYVIGEVPRYMGYTGYYSPGVDLHVYCHGRD